MSSETPENIAARPRRKSRSTLVEPFKQVKLGLYVMGISVAFILAAAGLFVAAFEQQYEHVMGIFNVVDPNLKWELVTNDIFYTNAIRLGVLFVAYLGILMAVVFRMTHRVYGPLVSIERFVNQVTLGQYSKRVNIRTGDDLQRLARKLNVMAERLEARHGAFVADPHVTEASLAEEDEDQEAV